MKSSAPSANEVPAGQGRGRAGVGVAGTVALLLVVLGGLNSGVVALFEFDLLAWLLGPASAAARAVHGMIGVAAVYCLVRLPRWSRAG